MSGITGNSLSLKPPKKLEGNPFRKWVDAVTQRVLGYQTYSYEETFTGKVWVDGNPIYRKVIDFGALPNATDKGVFHEIPQAPFNIVSISNVMTYPFAAASTIPFADLTATGDQIVFYVDDTKIWVSTSVDYSSRSAKFVIEYTKTKETFTGVVS